MCAANCPPIPECLLYSSWDANVVLVQPSWAQLHAQCLCEHARAADAKQSDWHFELVSFSLDRKHFPTSTMSALSENSIFYLVHALKWSPQL